MLSEDTEMYLASFTRVVFAYLLRKHYIASTLMLLIASFVQVPGQTPAQTPVRTNINAIVGIKVLFRNRKDKILLVFDDRRQAWEVPGTTHEGPITTSDLIRTLARDVGVSYNSLELRGLFTYHNPKSDITIVRPYYVARFRGYLDGKGFKDRKKTRWISLAEIRNVIPYPASVRIVEKLCSEPTRVWGGAFEEYGYTSPMTDRTAVKFRIIENFYRLN